MRQTEAAVVPILRPYTSDFRPPTSRGGFTLVELLVVIAIIAILAALLFPVFLSAKESATTAKCQSHEKQLVAALMMYTDDYAGWLPRIQFLTDRKDDDTGEDINLYRPYVRNLEILWCTGTAYRSMRFYDYENTRKIYSVLKPAFAYNQACLCGMPTLRYKNLSGSLSDVYTFGENKKKWPRYPGRPLSSVVNTGRTPAFFCSEAVHENDEGFGILGYGWEPLDIYNGWRMINPHHGGTNYAFLDGHVAWFLPNGRVTSYIFFYMKTDGIDYDGNGSVGEKDFMR